MSYSTNLKDSDISKIITKYQEYQLPLTNNYTLFRAKYKGCTITIFKTKTILFQGLNEVEVSKEICDLADITISNEKNTNASLSIDLSLMGSDEVGTGDVFGGIVVVASFVPKELISQVTKLGVKDSKELSDEKIIKIAPELIKKIPHTIHLLDNIKYNYFVKVRNFNMNKIKAVLHNSALVNLKKKIEKCDGIIIDAFTTQDKYFDYLSDSKTVLKEVKLIEKAENKYICVAVSSIIARYIFLKHLEELSKLVNFDIPKGSGNKADLAIQKILKTHNMKFFDNIAKTNFKNFEKVLVK